MTCPTCTHPIDRHTPTGCGVKVDVSPLTHSARVCSCDRTGDDLAAGEAGRLSDDQREALRFAFVHYRPEWDEGSRAYEVVERILAAHVARAREESRAEVEAGYAVPAGHHDPLTPGTPVLAWPGSRESSPLVTRTRSEVWAVASGDRVVKVEGYAGGIALTHIDVLPAALSDPPPTPPPTSATTRPTPSPHPTASDPTTSTSTAPAEKPAHSTPHSTPPTATCKE